MYAMEPRNVTKATYHGAYVMCESDGGRKVLQLRVSPGISRNTHHATYD